MASEERVVAVVHRWRPVTAETLEPEGQECLVVEGKEEKDGSR